MIAKSMAGYPTTHKKTKGYLESHILYILFITANIFIVLFGRTRPLEVNRSTSDISFQHVFALMQEKTKDLCVH